MAKVIVALTMSLDGFIAGANEDPDRPGESGVLRLFDWYFSGDTPVRQYQEAAERGVSVQPFKLAGANAAIFEDLIDEAGAVLTGRRTYDISNA
jgi:hypothetical protein